MESRCCLEISLFFCSKTLDSVYIIIIIKDTHRESTGMIIPNDKILAQRSEIGWESYVGHMLVAVFKLFDYRSDTNAVL